MYLSIYLSLSIYIYIYTNTIMYSSVEWRGMALNHVHPEARNPKV